MNVVTGEVKSASEPAPTPSKGFTLKFSKASPTLALSSVKVSPPAQQPKPKKEEPTGIINQIFDTKVNDGVTTVHETKILGTYIGEHYARVLESSSSILAPIVPSKAPSLSVVLPSPKLKISKPLQSLHIVEKSSVYQPIVTPQPPVVIEQHVNPEIQIHTEKSVVSSSGDDEFDENDGQSARKEFWHSATADYYL